MYSYIDIHRNTYVYMFICLSMFAGRWSSWTWRSPIRCNWVQMDSTCSSTPRAVAEDWGFWERWRSLSHAVSQNFWYFLQIFDSERCSFAWIFVALACDSFQLRISLPYFDIQEEGEASTDAPTQAQTRPHNCTQAWVSARLCRTFWTLRDGIPSMFQA